MTYLITIKQRIPSVSPSLREYTHIRKKKKRRSIISLMIKKLQIKRKYDLILSNSMMFKSLMR